MRIIYDNVYGCGTFAPTVTDSYPNMLQVSRGPKGGRLCWRKVRGARFGSYWLTDGGPSWLKNEGFWNDKQASALIRHFGSTLPRKGGTLLVQVYDSMHGWLVAVYHTTDSKARAVNPGRPKGFPVRV